MVGRTFNTMDERIKFIARLPRSTIRFKAPVSRLYAEQQIREISLTNLLKLQNEVHILNGISRDFIRYNKQRLPFLGTRKYIS